MLTKNRIFDTSKAALSLLTLFSFITTLYPSHNASRYNFFLEKPSDYSKRNALHLDIGGFYTTSSKAFGPDQETIGIPELLGKYDLLSVYGRSGAGGAVPLAGREASLFQANAPILIDTNNKTKTFGTTFRAEMTTGIDGLVLGAWAPFISTMTTTKYKEVEKPDQSVEEQEKAEFNDIARRNAHDNLGLTRNDWRTSGFGDVDLYLRWNKTWKRKGRLKNIDLAIQPGIIFPTGIKRNDNNPSSVPFMGDGHWGFYLDVRPECEIKESWKVGVLAGISVQSDKIEERRVPSLKRIATSDSLCPTTVIGGAPFPYSPQFARIKVSPGALLKFSPYITLENVSEDLHAQARYTYIGQRSDRWKNYSGQVLSSNLNFQEELSSWHAHMISFQVSYEPKFSLWSSTEYITPKFTLSVDTPITGRNVVKQHTISFNASYTW